MVAGGTGQLATALAAKSGQVRLVGRPDFDFDRPDTLTQAFAAITPTVVVNAAAWTAVDQAEAEADAARRANVDGPARLAALCAAAGIPLIHISTDYVFDGLKGAPYVETDPTSPTGVYGRTKLQGEHATLAANPRAVVLRTSWVYSATGKNFVKTMLAAGQVRDTLRVVADQRGCPTAAADLAEAILAIADQFAAGWQDRFAGVFHAAGTGDTTCPHAASQAGPGKQAQGKPRQHSPWPQPPTVRAGCGSGSRAGYGRRPRPGSGRRPAAPAPTGGGTRCAAACGPGRAAPRPPPDPG